jgi:hypothetical protein
MRAKERLAADSRGGGLNGVAAEDRDVGLGPIGADPGDDRMASNSDLTSLTC